MLLDPVVLVWYVYSIYLLFYIYVCLSVYEMCLYDVCIYSYDVYKVWVLLTSHVLCGLLANIPCGIKYTPGNPL